MPPKPTSASLRKGKQPDRQASVDDENNPQSSRENHRENGQLVSSSTGQQFNLPEALPSVPSFSKQQVHDLVNIQYFAPQNPLPLNQPPPTPPAPQEAQKEEAEQLLQQAIVKEDAENTAKKQEQQPLYHATVEDTTESTTKHDSSMPDSKSTLSTIPRLCTAGSSGGLAAYLSNALLLAYQHIMFLNTLLGYIEHSKGIEATGQG